MVRNAPQRIAFVAASPAPRPAAPARASSCIWTSSAPPMSSAIAQIWRRMRRLPTMTYMRPAVKSVFDCESTWYAVAESAESASK